MRALVSTEGRRARGRRGPGGCGRRAPVGSAPGRLRAAAIFSAQPAAPPVQVKQPRQPPSSAPSLLLFPPTTLSCRRRSGRGRPGEAKAAGRGRQPGGEQPRGGDAGLAGGGRAEGWQPGAGSYLRGAGGGFSARRCRPAPPRRGERGGPDPALDGISCKHV